MILYQQHIMWYESEMLNETLDSLQASLLHSTLPVKLKFCLNSQTYLEKPIEGEPEDMFNKFLNHPILKNAEIIYKTDSDPFYNIGDWRREIYSNEYKYTIWGESDCLIPFDFFFILSNLEIEEPHLVSLASRKMWDASWTCVEHEELKLFPYLDNQNPSNEELYPLRYYDQINQNQLDEFNEKNDIEIITNHTVKIDGSLLCISKGIDFQFIPDDMNFVREDFCAQIVFEIKKIPQYIVKTRIKGHNYNHSLKRTNTMATREDNIFKQYETKSQNSMNNFLKSLLA